MQTTTQDILMIILPILGLTLPGILKQDHYSPQANAIISGVILALTSAATAYTKDQFGPNFFIDAGVVLAGMSALLAGPLRGLDVYLQGNVFALVQKQLATTVPSDVAPVASASTPVTLPPGALIHITANTVHIPTSAPVTPSLPEVAPAVDPIIESPLAGAIVPGVEPVATGITTLEEASQKTQKIAAVKPVVENAG